MHSISNMSHLEYKIVVLEDMVKGLFVQTPQTAKTFMVSCAHYEALNCTLSSYPFLTH